MKSEALVKAKGRGKGVGDSLAGALAQAKMGLLIPLLLASDLDTLEICLGSHLRFWSAAWNFIVKEALVSHVQDFNDKKVSVLLDFDGMADVLTK